MSDIKVGQLIGPNQVRDAIHVAIAPVIAGELLLPGADVGLLIDEADVASRYADTPIGIVDPYLKQPVKKGERFWLFLYPGTASNLRHNWSHPAFGDKVSEPQVEEIPEEPDYECQDC